MAIRKGPRRSVIVEVGRWRFRLTIGRFRSGYERHRGFNVPGAISGVAALPFCLITFRRRRA